MAAPAEVHILHCPGKDCSYLLIGPAYTSRFCPLDGNRLVQRGYEPKTDEVDPRPEVKIRQGGKPGWAGAG